jgi:hypothetical protein
MLSFFSGTLGLDFKIPGVNVSGNAAGGMGIFVLVLLIWLRGAPRHINISVKADAPLEAMDRVLRDLEHVWKGVGLIKDGRIREPSIIHEIQGKGQGARIVFSERGRNGPVQTLTVEEVHERLSEPERQLLLDTERAMSKKLTAWRRAYAEIDDPSAANIDQKKKLLRIAAGMADDLEAIFGAIERTLNGELQDHYSAERWVASTAAGLLHQLELEESGPFEREFGE